MSEDRRVESVRALPEYRLSIVWRDGGEDVVDMTGVVSCAPLFVSLRDEAVFADVHVVAYGTGIEWRNGLDFSADSLACFAEGQKRMTGTDFRDWKRQMRLSLREVADLFGMAPSTMKTYLDADRELPVAFQIACAAMRRDRDMFLARFRPRRAGRPRRDAA